jgi:hypothetical protein
VLPEVTAVRAGFGHRGGSGGGERRASPRAAELSPRGTEGIHIQSPGLSECRATLADMITATTRDLVARLAELLAKERTALADFLLALSELNLRRGWAELGYATLYDFLVRELGMSKGTAFYRKVAVELVQRYPEVLEPLRDGRLCITAVHALSKAITPENRTKVLPRFFHVSKQEAKAISAEIAPAPEVPRREVVTTVRAVAPALDFGHAAQPVGKLCLQSTGAPREAPRCPAPASRPSPPVLEPLTAIESRLHITVSPGFLQMLDACKKALSHAMPGASAEEVLTEGMKLILAKDSKKKALVQKPRPRKAANEPRKDTRYIPAEVRRAVWERDQGKCQWHLESGGICGSELRPELDHVLGFKPGEPVRVEDLRILCRVHNDFAARLRLGDGLMERCRHRKAWRRSRQMGPSEASRPATKPHPGEVPASLG